jgi:16S rRNA pseudouridine516 synthase
VGLIEAGHVEISSQPTIEPPEPDDEFVTENLRFRVNGAEWPYCEKAYIVLHKPNGTECSQKPVNHPSIYSLLPAPLRDRPNPGGTPGVQAVGRLDQDTTGLLLLSDDGKFIHRMSSPKHHVPKIYEVTTKHEITGEQIARLVEGVVLDDDPALVRAAACVARAETQMSLTLTEGKYHQVKRMIAAVGNRVEALHRSQIGGYVLPADLAPGQWRWLTQDDLTLACKSSH